MKYLKFLMVAGLVTLVSAGAGAVMLYPEVGDTGNIGTALPSQDISSQEESMIQPPIEDIETGVAKEEKEELDGNAYGIKDHQLKLEELEIEPDKKDVPPKKLNEKINEIIDKIKQFYGVEDLSQLGEYGKHLKELFDRLITESPSSFSSSFLQDIRIREVYKNGTYILELSWKELNMGASIDYKLRFEGTLTRNGKISPTELVVKEDAKYVTWPPSGVKRTYIFSFGPNGITDEKKKEEKWRDRI